MGLPTMKKATLLLFIHLALVCYAVKVSGQDSLKTQPRNVIYANVGTLGLWLTTSANYERQLLSTDTKYYATYYMRACGGVFATWGANGPYGSLSLQGVYGKEKAHLELGLGLAALYDQSSYKNDVSNANEHDQANEPEPLKKDYTYWTPAASVGYRYQRPTGGFVFRTGIGFPDGAYVSIGLAF